jgi:ABC-2 type transport system permease protein
VSSFGPTIHSSRVIRIASREWQRIAARPSLYGLMVLMPIVLFGLLAAIYMHKVATALPIAIVDNDHSEISRLIVRAAESTRSLEIVQYCQSVGEMREKLLEGRIQGAICIPEGAEATLKKGEPAHITVYRNGSNLIVSNSIYKDGLTVVRTVSAGILMKKLRSRGLSEQQAMTLANPIRLESQILFNPGYNYLNYLIPGLLPMLLQMLIMLAAVLVISSELHDGTFGQLADIAGRSVVRLLVGKSLPYLLIFLAGGMAIIGIVFPVFGIPFNGSVLAATVLFGLFVLACFSFGLAISCCVPELLLATEISLIVNTPAFLFSGYTFPLWAVPTVHYVFAQCLPFTHFLNGFISIYEVDAPIRYLLPYAGRLGIFVILGVAISFFMLRRRLGRLQEAQP